MERDTSSVKWACPIPPSSAPQVPLHNRFETLELEGEVSEGVEGGPPLRLPWVKWLTQALRLPSPGRTEG